MGIHHHAPAASLACLIFLLSFPLSNSQISFVYQGFKDKDLILEEASIIKETGLLRLTNSSQNVIGHAFYPDPIQLFDRSSQPNPNASSFSTDFVFAIVKSSSSSNGYGLAFTLAPSTQFPGAGSEHFLGLFNSSNDGHASNHIFAVEFDTVKGYNEKIDSAGNHVGININSMESKFSSVARYYVNGPDKEEEIELESGNPIRAWIDYDGVNKTINVTIAPLNIDKPSTALLSQPLDLTPDLTDKMYVGFSSSTGKKTSSHYILGWSFAINKSAQPLNTSDLPPVPKPKSSSNYNPDIVALLGALSALALVGIILLVILFRRMQATKEESLEQWELDCPHRFSYKDLFKATNGFKDSEIIGVGGFGAVYKGVLRSSGSEVAVKKVTRNSAQGVREFAAEIESLGRLRHKNLVNLQGWCKKKNDLLIVYDYIPNGSLDSLLYHPKNNFTLNWEQRFVIIKGIASGLLYLHEEWEQVVIHRDIKPSNVLIDGEMNARLGDFGLARLYDHDDTSHTTHIVGTLGYIAPELARHGKVSRCSDVFAFGVLLLEVATGRKPLMNSNQLGVDWVMECHQMGRVLETADPKLNSVYDVEEMQLVLVLGLLCSHQKPESRPTTRQIIRFLHGDESLPPVDNWMMDSERSNSNSSFFIEVISDNPNSRSFPSSSTGPFSSNSMENGR